MKRRGLILCALVGFGPMAWAAEPDPVACLGEIKVVCAGLEDKLEVCLSDKGSQLSADCRDQLQSAMTLMQDPSGPASCVPDIKRFCQDMTVRGLSACISDNKAKFGPACRKYLQSSSE